jgi:hypothetical protein
LFDFYTSNNWKIPLISRFDLSACKKILLFH